VSRIGVPPGLLSTRFSSLACMAIFVGDVNSCPKVLGLVCAIFRMLGMSLRLGEISSSCLLLEISLRGEGIVNLELLNRTFLMSFTEIENDFSALRGVEAPGVLVITLLRMTKGVDSLRGGGGGGAAGGGGGAAKTSSLAGEEGATELEDLEEYTKEFGLLSMSLI